MAVAPVPALLVVAVAGWRITVPAVASRAVVAASWIAAVTVAVGLPAARAHRVITPVWSATSGNGGVRAPYRLMLSVSGGHRIPRLAAVAVILKPTPAVAHPRPAVFPLEGVH